MRASLVAITMVACAACAAADGADDDPGDDGELGPHQAPPFPGTDTADADEDGIADALEDYLVEQFAPRLLLPPDDIDWTRPAYVGWYLARVHMRFDHPNCGDHEILALGAVDASSIWQQSHETSSGFEPFCSHTDTVRESGPSDGSYSAHKDFFIQAVDDGEVHPGIPPERKHEWRVYAHVQRSAYGEAAYDVQVWTFYPYNDFIGGANHEGDWEHVTISVTADLAFVSAYYASHGEGQRFDDAEQLDWIDRTHPIGFVADGSHAIYATAGTHASGIPLADDHTYDGGPVWDTWTNFVNLGERGKLRSDEQAWARYAGRWGEVGNIEDTSGPVGPMYSGRWGIQGSEY